MSSMANGTCQPETPDVWDIRWRTSMSCLPFSANSGQYFATGAKASMAPRSIAINAANAVSVFVHEKKFTMVSCPHGTVFARSACPPQMSTTSSPSMSTAMEAPNSSPLPSSSANASATCEKRLSQCPCTTSFIGPSCAETIRFRATSSRRKASTIRCLRRTVCSGKFPAHGEESDAQNRHGPRDRRGDVGPGSYRADGVRGADVTRHEHLHPARGACRAESDDAGLPWDDRRHGLRTRLVLARRLARLGLLSLLTKWSCPHEDSHNGRRASDGRGNDSRRFRLCRSTTRGLQHTAGRPES